MTDVPTFAFSMVALVVASQGVVRSHPLRWLVLALAFAAFAFTIREYAAAAGVAALVVHALAAPARRTVGLIGVGWLAGLAVLFMWRSGLEHTVSFGVDLAPGSFGDGIAELCAALLTLAFFVSPVLLAVSVASLRRWVRGAWWPGLALALGVVAVAVIAGGGFVGNYLSPNGPGSGFWPGTPSPVVPRLLLVAAGAVAIAAATVLVVLTTRLVVDGWQAMRGGARRDVLGDAASWAANQPPALVAASAYALLVGGLMATTLLVLDAPFFDRYLISLVPIVAALSARAIVHHGLGPAAELSGLRRRLAPAAAAVVLGLCGAAVFDGTAARDGLAWELAQHLNDQGVVADRIEGGPWSGYHQADWWTRADQPSTACAAVRHRDGLVQGVMVRSEERRTVVGVTFGLEAVVYDGRDPDCAQALAGG
jgi:hypothetical protein